MRKTKKPRKARKFNLRTRVVAALRDVWRKSHYRHDVVKAARIAPATYRCAVCARRLRDRPGRPTAFRIDHIEPVVPLTGFTTWGDFIDRLFAPVGALQLLCLSCHDAKTDQEREMRKALRDLGFTKP